MTLNIDKAKLSMLLFSAGLMSAFIYYSFNDPAKKTPISSSDSSMSTYTISWTGGSEPGRNSPVVVCDGVGASCLQIWNRLPCLWLVLAAL